MGLGCGVVWCGVVCVCVGGCVCVWCGVVWCGVVWCGGVWCGVVWCGVVWCGVVWCGVVVVVVVRMRILLGDVECGAVVSLSVDQRGEIKYSVTAGHRQLHDRVSVAYVAVSVCDLMLACH